MPKYVVYGTLHVGVFTIVTAKNKAEARRIAEEDRGIISLCCRCGGSEEEAKKEWCLSNGTNGDVTVSRDSGSVERDE